MKKNIVTDISFLRKKSEQATEEEAKSLIIDLQDSLDLKKGVGLSAVQIGVLKQVSIVRLPNMKIDIINPVILQKGNPFRFEGEGCLSLVGIRVDTRRYWRYSFVCKEILYNLEGIDAVVAQHEIDHILGLTILQRKWRAK